MARPTIARAAPSTRHWRSTHQQSRIARRPRVENVSSEKRRVAPDCCARDRASAWWKNFGVQCRRCSAGVVAIPCRARRARTADSGSAPGEGSGHRGVLRVWLAAYVQRFAGRSDPGQVSRCAAAGAAGHRARARYGEAGQARPRRRGRRARREGPSTPGPQGPASGPRESPVTRKPSGPAGRTHPPIPRPSTAAPIAECHGW